MIHNSEQMLNLESEMEMMSAWREQISNVISVWMWNIRRRNRSCDGLSTLLVPLSRLTCEILWRPEGQHQPSVVKTYHTMNRRPILFSTDFIYSESRWKKNSSYTFKITQVQTSIRQEIQALTHWNINRISRQTCTHTFRQACQKGAPLWNRTSWNCQEKHSLSQRAIPVLSNDFAFMTRKKFYPFALF